HHTVLLQQSGDPMTVKTGSSIQHNQDHAGTASVPWYKIVMWAVLFQLAWYWNIIPNLLTEGSMQDTDDYQRLLEVRSWMAGQSWYDVTNYRMDPPFGAEMHWSRLVDVPIAALVWFFDLFVDISLAERITAIVWPAILLIITVFMVLAICRRLDASINPLLALLFTVTCVTALTEFRPGRLDHHSIQILFFLTIVLGLVSTSSRLGYFLIAFAAAASISIGLDAILLIVLALAWIGLEWALGNDRDGAGLIRTGIGLLVAMPVMMAVTISPDKWFLAACDQISILYVQAFSLIGATFIVLALAGRQLDKIVQNFSAGQSAAIRLALGGLLAGFCAFLVLTLHPQCASGPFGAIDPELQERWLGGVNEAKGLAEQMAENPQLWVWVFAYGILMLAIAAYVLKSRFSVRREFLVLFVLLAASFLAGFLQYRALRIGVFAAIPFCVVFWHMLWQRVSAYWPEGGLKPGIVQTVATVMLLSPTWLGAASLLPSSDDTSYPIGTAVASESRVPDWKLEEPDLLCNRQSQFKLLASLPNSFVMTDINSGPATLVFTDHDVVGGPYHRNTRAILDMVDFYTSDLQKPEQIARRRGVDYVTYCEMQRPLKKSEKASDALLVHIMNGTEPAWLKRLSDENDRLHVFKVELQ
ncbi:MAG: hypothetical protein ACR2O0_01895, partial [Rhizobiaceae bacterium]